MKQFSFLLFLLFLCSSQSFAQLLLQPTAEYSIQADYLRYRSGSTMKNGVIFGAITGAIAGAVVGYFNNPPGCDYQPGVCVSHDRFKYALNKAGIGAALGAGLGLSIGIVMEYGGMGMANQDGPVNDQDLYYTSSTFAEPVGPKGKGLGIRVRW